MKDKEFVTVKTCARCGKDHEHLEFRKFRDTPIIGLDGVWNYWGICPETMEPVLLKFVESK